MINPRPSTSTPRFLTPLRLVAFSLTAFITLMILGAGAIALTGQRALRLKIEQLKLEGRPVTTDGLVPVCRPEENACSLWEKAATLHTMSTAESAILRPAWTSWATLSAQDKEALRRHLVANKAVGDIMREAAARPFFTYAALAPGKSIFEQPAPQIIGSAKRCRLFVLYRGRLAAEEGDHAQAMECLLLGGAMARSFARLPMWISSRTAVALLEITTTLAEEIVPAMPMDLDKTRKLIADLDPAIYRHALATGTELNRLGWLEATTHTLARQRPPVGLSLGGEWVRKLPPRAQETVVAAISPFIAGDGVLIQDFFIRETDLIQHDPWRRDQRVEELHHSLRGHSVFSIWARAALDDSMDQDQYRKFDRILARAQVARVALACRVIHSETGAYPQTLAELAPTVLPRVPLDPFTGEPLIYQLGEDGGFLLYSAGPDKIAWHEPGTRAPLAP